MGKAKKHGAWIYQSLRPVRLVELEGDYEGDSVDCKIALMAECSKCHGICIVGSYCTWCGDRKEAREGDEK